jgi:hypothetical protein
LTHDKKMLIDKDQATYINLNKVRYNVTDEYIEAQIINPEFKIRRPIN